MSIQINVLGETLSRCSIDPVTGFYRTGSCETGEMDHGSHVICARMTENFLAFTKQRGNDLTTPMPAYNFPGLKAGDQWCLCALRWKEAYEAGVAPEVNLSATHQRALLYVSLAQLKEYAVVTPGK